MADGSSQLARGGPLGRWIMAPFAVLLLFLLVAYFVPQASVCETEGNGLTTRDSILLGICGLASLGFAAAALRRFLALERQGRIWRGVGYAVVIVPVVGLALSFALPGGESLFGSLMGIGALLSGGSLLALFVAWIARRRVEEVGLLLPLYLTGAGVFCFPTLAGLVLVAGSGALCG
jgi:hypothetical protein